METATSAVHSFMGKDAGWSVPLAILIAVPMYSSAGGIVPVVQALLAKGAALGTALAFMVGVIALSLAEGIILGALEVSRGRAAAPPIAPWRMRR